MSKYTHILEIEIHLNYIIVNRLKLNLNETKYMVFLGYQNLFIIKYAAFKVKC